MNPIDYRVQVAQPFLAGLQGFQAINQVMDQQAARAEAQRQAEMQRQAQMRQQEALGAYFANPNPTAQDYAKVLAAAPQLREQLGAGWSAMNEEQRKNNFSFGSQAYSAALSGKPEQAAQMFRDRATAIRNAKGSEQEAAAHEAIAKLVEQYPQYATRMIGLRLAAADPDRFSTIMQTLGQENRAEAKASAELRQAIATANKAESEAQTAAVAAKYADSAAVLDLQKKGWDIKALEADTEFKRQNTRIAYLNAQIARETNELKRQELQVKLDEAKEAREAKAREKESNFTDAMTQLDDALQLVDEIRSSPSGLWWATGATADTAAVPGTGARTTAGKIEQLKNALAAPNLEKLKGAVSDKDIEFIKNIAANLDRRQPTADVEREIAKIEATLLRGRQDTAKRFGAPVPERRRLTPATETTTVAAARSPEESAPVQITSDAEYNALPSGATFVAPDGTVRRKP